MKRQHEARHRNDPSGRIQTVATQEEAIDSLQQGYEELERVGASHAARIASARDIEELVDSTETGEKLRRSGSGDRFRC